MKVDPTSSRKLERFSECSHRPARIVHRGFLVRGELSWREWWQWTAYAIDQVVTGSARPFVTPVRCAQKAVAHKRGKGVMAQVTAGTLGALWGSGKGAVGGAYSLALGAGGLCKSANFLCVGVPMTLAVGIGRAARHVDAAVAGA